ncbi:MAG TPA: DUF3857 domain-containing protein [Thermoanaerobaculia bacterium]|nr:DUF3857 domain-containing protein [Thermoanaerobaculia bacterium]
MIRRALAALALLALAAPAFARGAVVPEWLLAAAKTPLPSYPAGTRAVVLLDSTLTFVNDKGEIATRVRRAVKILGTEGRDLAYISVLFDGQRAISTFHGWGIDAANETYEVTQRDAVETAAYEGELYGDLRMKSLRVPAADPGCVIGYEIIQRETPLTLQDSWHFQSEDPIVNAEYTLQLPAGWSHEEHWFNAAAPTPVVSADTTRWQFSNVEPIKDEPSMPSWRGIAGRMEVNLIPPRDKGDGRAHRTWTDVSRWYAGLTGPRGAATPQLLAKTTELTNGRSAAFDRIRAIASFAQKDVRYVAIEIGVGGYQPHLAGEIFANRYGDCKDKVTVLRTMLKQAGIDSYYVLVNTNRDAVARDFASMTSFNHAIIAIKLPDDAPKQLHAALVHPQLGRILLFDPTSTSTPLGSLPSYLQQNRGLLVTDNGGELIELPAHPADANRLEIAGTMKLGTDGTLDGEVAETRSGWLAASWRSHLLTLSEPERKKYLEGRLNYALTQHTLKTWSVDNVDDLTKDLVIHYTFTAPHYARRAAGMLLVRPRVVGYPTTPLDLKERKYAYETDGPYVEVNDLAITLPPGLGADELPPPQSITGPALSYTSESKLDAGTLRYHRQLRMEGFRVPVAGLPELNKALTAISADERNKAVLK